MSLSTAETIAPKLCPPDLTPPSFNAVAMSAVAIGSVSGSTQGRFFGANPAPLAGIATFAGNSQYDTAFGGSKN